MNPPTLCRVPTAPLPAGAVLDPAGLVAFEVVRGGEFDGVTLVAGERLLVRAGAQGDGRVVLVPRGHGRPTLGRRDGGRLSGAWGEPCHRDRWEAVGRIAWRARVDERGLRVEPVSAVAPAPAVQLAMFAA